MYNELVQLKERCKEMISDSLFLQLDDFMDSTDAYIKYADEIISKKPCFKKILQMCKFVEENSNLREKPLHIQVKKTLEKLMEFMDDFIQEFQLFDEKYVSLREEKGETMLLEDLDSIKIDQAFVEKYREKVG
jgi:hypothetical protein